MRANYLGRACAPTAQPFVARGPGALVAGDQRCCPKGCIDAAAAVRRVDRDVHDSRANLVAICAQLEGSRVGPNDAELPGANLREGDRRDRRQPRWRIESPWSGPSGRESAALSSSFSGRIRPPTKSILAPHPPLLPPQHENSRRSPARRREELDAEARPEIRWELAGCGPSISVMQRPRSFWMTNGISADKLSRAVGESSESSLRRLKRFGFIAIFFLFFFFLARRHAPTLAQQVPATIRIIKPQSWRRVRRTMMAMSSNSDGVIEAVIDRRHRESPVIHACSRRRDRALRDCGAAFLVE